MTITSSTSSTSSTSLTVEVLDGTPTVTDTSGNRWWPSASAEAEILAAASMEEAALRMVAEAPMRGTWKS